jgi:diguanylate cyclase (GGDEF)-like protein
LKTLERANGFLERRSRASLVVTAVALVVGIFAFDYFAGQDITAALFYLVPIAMVAWYVGSAEGVLLSAVSAAGLYLADILWGETRFHPLAATWNSLVPLGFFLLFVALLGLLRRSRARAEVLSRTDPLTGLFNKRYFRELADAEIARARRYPHPISVAYIDLDDFKAVNDEHGHDRGDELLKLSAALLRSGLRSTDVVARLGGDEFVVMLPEGEAGAGVQVVLKLRGTFREAMKDAGWPVSMSIGLVTFVRPPDSVDEMLKWADSLMYEVKREGKDDVKMEVVGQQPPL